MKKEVKGTLWVLLTLIGVVCGGCALLMIIGLITYGVTGNLQQP